MRMVIMVALLFVVLSAGCISVQHEESYEDPPPDYWDLGWGSMWASVFMMLFIAVVVIVFVVLLGGGAIVATIKAAEAGEPEPPHRSGGQGDVRVAPREDLDPGGSEDGPKDQGE